jgi:hypothetical protein
MPKKQYRPTVEDFELFKIRTDEKGVTEEIKQLIMEMEVIIENCAA